MLHLRFLQLAVIPKGVTAFYSYLHSEVKYNQTLINDKVALRSNTPGAWSQ